AHRNLPQQKETFKVGKDVSFGSPECKSDFAYSRAPQQGAGVSDACGENLQALPQCTYLR
ncbi:MAG: hypothetical protein RBQ87_09045, partial [Candidatus Cloacimonadaceae bacterium]|nr:hypothetical protein [Candidatus Cloacimonadaceae bacterium]